MLMIYFIQNETGSWPRGDRFGNNLDLDMTTVRWMTVAKIKVKTVLTWFRCGTDRIRLIKILG